MVVKWHSSFVSKQHNTEILNPNRQSNSVTSDRKQNPNCYVRVLLRNGNLYSIPVVISDLKSSFFVREKCLTINYIFVGGRKRSCKVDVKRVVTIIKGTIHTSEILYILSSYTYNLFYVILWQSFKFYSFVDRLSVPGRLIHFIMVSVSYLFDNYLWNLSIDRLGFEV